MKTEINNFHGRLITLKWWHFKLGMKYKCLTLGIKKIIANSMRAVLL
ncbi:hypothetical protein BMS3Bbin08_00642 [bacterium BMS3Bbin08]|nr:hypothetical protein BMS3Bbin08_00642 [bacterium BMS3Bbin08]